MFESHGFSYHLDNLHEISSDFRFLIKNFMNEFCHFFYCSKHYEDGAIIKSDEMQILHADMIGLGAVDFRSVFEWRL